MLDRFDFEQHLMAAFSTKDDLELLYEKSLDPDVSREDLANALLGLIHLHGMRCDRMFDTFEFLIEKKVISSKKAN